MSYQYADLDNLLADYLPDAKKQSEKDAISRILSSVSMFVDSYCRRNPRHFSGVEIPAIDEESEATLPDATEKRFRGAGERFLQLPVHIFGSIESVKYAETVIDSSRYYESDKNGWLYSEQSAVSSEQSFGLPLTAHCSLFQDGVIYKVEAVWGYRNTPEDLQEAVRQTVERIWRSERGVLGQISPNGFVIERALPEFAREVLNTYKKREFEIS